MTQLAKRSKAHWGYSQDLIEAWKGELTITEEFIRRSAGSVAERNGKIIGYWISEPIQSEKIFEGFLFIEPSEMGKGLGKLLFNALCESLREKGVHSFMLEADPNAAGFYYKMGGIKIGDKASLIVPGRKLPVIQFTF